MSQSRDSEIQLLQFVHLWGCEMDKRGLWGEGRDMALILVATAQLHGPKLPGGGAGKALPLQKLFQLILTASLWGQWE